MGNYLFFLLTFVLWLDYISPMRTISTFKPKKKVPKMAASGVLNSRVREFREKHKLTLRELSAGCRVPHSTIIRMEYGCEVELTKALRLARFFETDVNSLFSLR